MHNMRAATAILWFRLAFIAVVTAITLPPLIKDCFAEHRAKTRVLKAEEIGGGTSFDPETEGIVSDKFSYVTKTGDEAYVEYGIEVNMSGKRIKMFVDITDWAVLTIGTKVIFEEDESGQQCLRHSH